VIADGRVALDADDSAPNGGAVIVFTFENRCHSSNLGLYLGLVGWRCWLRLFFVAPPLHRATAIKT